MARPLRIEYPDSFFHITARGNNKQKIFLSDEDRYFFLKQLQYLHERFQITIHAYCLMPNHFHLEITPPSKILSRAMQWLNLTYATYFNRRHRKVGHLFQGRFSSVIVETDTHLSRLTKYIHLNPVKANIVHNPEEYIWSSYRAYLGICDKPFWLNINDTLRNFGKVRDEQRTNYKSFIEAIEEDDPMKEIHFASIIGSESYVEKVRKGLHEISDDPEISQLIKAKKTITIKDIIYLVIEHFNVKKGEIIKRDVKNNNIRDLLIFLCRKYTNETYLKIGSHFENLRPSAISLACKRIENQLSANGIIKTDLKEIEMKIFKTLNI
jgi:REP element-mobilizing transposase RayT